MRAVRIAVQGFGPFRERTSIPLEDFTTIVGRNDVGKSFFLRALDLFLNEAQFTADYAHMPRIADLETYIEMTFEGFPTTLELEAGVPTTLTEENLLDPDDLLTVRKTYSTSDPKKVEWCVVVNDFGDATYSGLSVLKEDELNQRGATTGLQFTKSSPGNTNKSKRQALRATARQRG
jgi:putative ATP-dependent endonuclease of the OLD family